MTNVIILGEQPKKKELKPIEFIQYLDYHFEFNSNCTKPQRFKNIELICRKYLTGYDLMFAYDEDRNQGVLYLGHFNDGVV